MPHLGDGACGGGRGGTEGHGGAGNHGSADSGHRVEECGELRDKLEWHQKRAAEVRSGTQLPNVSCWFSADVRGHQVRTSEFGSATGSA